jgi:uncharacterized protein with PIN domain
MRRTVLKESKKKVKNILKKVWRNENVLYLCAALRNKRWKENDFKEFKPNKKKLKKLSKKFGGMKNNRTFAAAKKSD